MCAITALVYLADKFDLGGDDLCFEQALLPLVNKEAAFNQQNIARL